ncbi:MAG: hypothetical protein CMJ85_14005 [Planctomycetes bacterium]|nr:hypothetical protein [Planctomycetota bacterium]
MCGIAGHAGVLDDRLAGALDSLAHRGQDQQGSDQLAGFALGCRRLAITDEAAWQPLVIGEPGRRLAIVMNGSIAAPDSLRRVLAGHGEACATQNDAELPLRLYRSRGLPGLAGLRGQFAFAIRDEAEDSVVLGRDPFGEKPLFVGPGRPFPAFASTVAALRMLVGEPSNGIDSVDLATFVRFGFLNLERSCFGSRLRAFPRGTFRAYYGDGRTAEASTDMPPAAERSEETLLALLRDAVGSRLHGDRPVGVFLSGGVDSSLIAALLSERGARPLCLSLDFVGGSAEGARAARTARHLGLPHDRRSVDHSLLDELPDLVRHAGVPLGDPSLLAVVALARQARQRGIGIVLSGEGGDELFLGYRRQRAIGWARLARDILPPMVVNGCARATGRRALPRLARAVDGDYGELLAIAEQADVERLFGVAPRSIAARTSDSAVIDARELDVGEYLAWDLCPKLDLGSLVAGVEARSPFLDVHLLAWARRWVRATGEARGKLATRAVLARFLPQELRGGRKLGLAPPIASWLAESPWVADALASARSFDAHRINATLKAITCFTMKVMCTSASSYNLRLKKSCL